MRNASPGRDLRLTLVPGLLMGLVGGLTGCGGSPSAEPPARPPSPIGEGFSPDQARETLAARAAAAQDQAGTSSYTLTHPEQPDRVVTVVRARDGGWRVDMIGGAPDVSVVSDPASDQLYHCHLPSPPEPAGCVAVDEIPAEDDPRFHRLFDDWLAAFTDRSAAIAVVSTGAPDGMSGDCFSVEPSAAGLVAAVDGGVYCYHPDGTLTGAQLPAGTLLLTQSDPAAPESVRLPGPIVPGPLPTGTPSPSPAATSAPPG